MVSIWIYIISGLLILGVCPFLGKIFYEMKSKFAIWFYLGSAAIVTTILLIISRPSSIAFEDTFINYFKNLIRFKPLYLFTFITYLLAGIGIIGGILEYVGEQTESEEAYKNLKKLSKIRLYFFYLIYGYIFFFAIFACSQFIMIFFQREYNTDPSLIQGILETIQFHNIIITGIGVLLFARKSFHYGFFSFEFYRSEFDPAIADLNPWRREFRRGIAVILGIGMLFICGFIYFLEKYTPNTAEDISYGKSIFFLAATVEAVIFYIFRNRFIDQLKPASKQFGLKVGTGRKLGGEEEEEEKQKQKELEIRYDD
ncbi:MAG: hypothetical protein ACTSWL_03820 [Promethearchaeota archaeon]